MSAMNTTEATTQRPVNRPSVDLMVSVVIPAYNAASFIQATLNSVRAQTFTNYEIIVVNDGSPDTPKLELALQPYLSEIQYIKQPNGGPSSARNSAIRQARGKYIAFLDSDDLWLPQHLARQVELLEKDPALGLVYSNAVHIEGYTPVGVAFANTPQSLPVTFEALLRERSTVNTSSAVASRQAILDAGLFDESMDRCEDYDLWLRMARNGVGITFTHEVQMCHRLGNGLAGNSELMKRGRIRVYEKALSAGALTEQQSRMIREKIEAIEADVQLELSKQALLAGDFERARNAAREANAAAASWKLRATVLGMRLFPALLQHLYRSHIRKSQLRKQTQRAQSLKDIGFTTSTLDLEQLARPKP